MKKWQTELFLPTRPSVNSIGRFITATLITFACISLKSVAAPIVYVQETVPGTQQWFTNQCAIKSMPSYLAIDSSPTALLSQCKNDTYMTAKPVVGYPYFCELSPISGRATGLNNDQNSSLICRQYNEFGGNVSAGMYMDMSTIYSCPVTTPPEVSWTYSGTLRTCERWVPASPTACPAGQKTSQYPLTSPTANPAQPTYGCVLDCSAQPNTHANLDSTACVPDDACKDVPYLKPLPTAASDPRTAALESSQGQAVIDKVCGPLTPQMKNEVACLNEKLAVLKLPAMQINNAVRSQAYQAHFWDIWSGMERVMKDDIQSDPVKKAACATRRLELAKEKGCNRAGDCTKDGKTINPTTGRPYPVSDCTGGHCFVGGVAKNPGAGHPERKAIDIPNSQVIALRTALGTQTVKGFLAAPGSTNCPALPKLKWGGDYITHKDFVHFYLD